MFEWYTQLGSQFLSEVGKLRDGAPGVSAQVGEGKAPEGSGGAASHPECQGVDIVIHTQKQRLMQSHSEPGCLGSNPGPEAPAVQPQPFTCAMG